MDMQKSVGHTGMKYWEGALNEQFQDFGVSFTESGTGTSSYS